MAHRIPEPQVPVQPLRVLPRGLALVQDYRALMNPGHSTNRHHGWKFDSSLGPEMKDRSGTVTGHHGGRVKQVDLVVVIAADDEHRREYIQHLKQGDLWAADEATAREAGIAFEPHFGGEHPATSAEHGLDEPKLLAALRVAGFRPDAPAAALFDEDFKPKVPTAAEILKAKQPASPPTTPAPASK